MEKMKVFIKEHSKYFTLEYIYDILMILVTSFVVYITGNIIIGVGVFITYLIFYNYVGIKTKKLPFMIQIIYILTFWGFIDFIIFLLK